MRYLPTAELTPEDTVILFVVSGSSGGVGRQMGVEAAEKVVDSRREKEDWEREATVNIQHRKPISSSTTTP